jgi:hypothetical protein
VRDVFHQVAWAVKQLVRFGASLQCAWFPASRTIGDSVPCNYLQQLIDQLFLFLLRASLRDRDAELAHRIDGAFKTQLGVGP